MFVHLKRVSRLQLKVILFSALLLCNQAVATEIEGGVFLGFQQPASVANIKTIPSVQHKGEDVNVEISGVWNNACVPDIKNADYIYSPSIRTILILSYNWMCSDTDTQCCRDTSVYKPTDFNGEVTIPASVWESLVPNQDGIIGIEFQARTSTVTGSAWRREFDLVWGLHEIPPRLGSGNWISDELPYQGLMIQQQDDVAVFHELNYNRQSGEPNWHYATARFNGNASNGVSYFIDWLAPSEDPLVQPTRDELSFAPTSAGIVVTGYNRVKAFLGMTHEVTPPSHNYKRWVFSPGKQQFPPVVPDMVGQWNLYGFNGQQLDQSFEIEFKSGTKIDTDLYRFTSIDDEWVLNCQVTLDGEGECTLSNEINGLKLPFDLLNFNGNYAKGKLAGSGDPLINQTGILLRSEFHLPVLDLQ